MIAHCIAPVKKFYIKNQQSLKIDKTDRKTQEICGFILQEGCNFGQIFEGKSRKQVQWRGFCGILINVKLSAANRGSTMI